MGKLIINSLFYRGDFYYYKNTKLSKGVNLLVGDNGNGKSTFTYLLVYGLGLNVEYFSENSVEPINEIVNDTNNYIELSISVNDRNFVIKRSIGQNVITVFDEYNNDYTSYSLIRNGYIYKKEEKTFSDWILSELGIDIIEIAQNNTTHRVNFDDLMRYIYYDQSTENRKIINEFGIKSNDFFKNSNIMKRSIFEILMSGYNERYYKEYYKLKDLLKEMNAEKQFYKSIEILKNDIVKQLEVSNRENVNEELMEVRNEIKRLESIREEIREEKHFGEEVTARLLYLQKSVVKLTHKINNIEFEINDVQEGLLKSKRVKDDIERDIQHIDKILFTAKFIDIVSEDECPFCLEQINLEEGKCLCGSDKHLDFSRFIYSDKEYVDIIKSKIKTLETIKDTIFSFQEEYNHLLENLTLSKKEHNICIEEIKSITKDLGYNSNIHSIDEITNRIINLKEKKSELVILKEKKQELNKSKIKIESLEDKINISKEALKRLEEEKEIIFQNNLEKFEEIYSNYLNDFYKELDINFTVKLDRNYLPVMGEYKHQSFNVLKRLFFYLTLLKLSLDEDYSISYPKFLIIDTLKDEGIEIPHLKKLFTYIDEFKDSDCQIIITSGYDEFEDNQEEYLIGWLNDKHKLLRRRKKIKRKY
ncbi:hypothetical protein LXM56_13555 [Lysinibacillus fusiformis]|uniref:AAA family ATPase n=1 Tax=Lysinibacillus fusiformis TaxID=28031 RepID=UPI001E44705A|nr:AAA family ATPase [Lysinibacillus fusiformis]MCE4045160.1 hypothetical protein [Lysinibacillus fusiformis]